MTQRFVLALHGGAGTIAPGTAADEAPYRAALLEALAAGEAVLERGGGGLDAVVASVVPAWRASRVDPMEALRVE